MGTRSGKVRGREDTSGSIDCQSTAVRGPVSGEEAREGPVQHAREGRLYPEGSGALLITKAMCIN